MVQNYGDKKGLSVMFFSKFVIIFSLTSESDSIACTFPCTSTLVYEIMKDWIYIMTANGLSLVKKYVQQRGRYHPFTLNIPLKQGGGSFVVHDQN